MTQTGKAVLCRETGKTVVVETVHFDPPQRDEVMLQIEACGVCHSDLSAVNGTIPMPPPLVLGHEAVGTICALGEGVTDLAIGNRVLVSWVPSCGRCRYCATGRPALCDASAKATVTLGDGTTRLRDADGSSLYIFSGVGVMAEYAVIHRDNAIVIDAEVPPAQAAIVGCAVTTGVGAALNTAGVEPGSSCAVFGAGGIGLSAIQGCAIAGASTIVAVDPTPQKRDFASRLGATHCVDPGAGNPVAEIRRITGGGADYSFECVGSGAIVRQTYDAVRKGGTAVVVGVAKPGDPVTLDAFAMPLLEKRLVGSFYGSARPSVDFPRMLEFYASGRLKLDEMITATYSIDEAPEAFADLEAGVNARGIISFF